MNIKYYGVVMLLLVIAIIFVPFIPDDSEVCDPDFGCEDSASYVSLYTKYTK
ncbi:MAG: hypothetical protein RLZZ308_38 [Candidatus Parcubacteria bacterium]|jgi:hypothetical protein